MPTVYVVGSEKRGTLHDVATVWKDGVATPLTDGSRYAWALSVAISGSDVYVAGTEYAGTAGLRIAMVWKNGVPTPLTDGSKDARALSVTISGRDVYVAGAEFGGTAPPLHLAIVWKNGVPAALPLTDVADDASAESVAVSGDDIYVAGGVESRTSFSRSSFLFDVAMFWKNGIATPLTRTDGTEEGWASSVLVKQH